MGKEERREIMIELMSLIGDAEAKQLQRMAALRARGLITDHELAKGLGEIADHFDMMRSLVL